MRKNRVIALVVASLVSTASVAGAQASAPAAPRAGRHAMGPGFEGRGARGMLFHGIALSDGEKARLKEIHAKYEAEGKPIREAVRPAMQEARAARQKGDTAAARAAFERTKADRDKMKALMERERTEIRSALTPANQQKFDANVQELAKRREEWEKNGGKDGHGMRGVKRGQNG